MTKTKATR